MRAWVFGALTCVFAVFMLWAGLTPGPVASLDEGVALLAALACAWVALDLKGLKR